VPSYTLTLTDELDALATEVAAARGLAGTAALIEAVASEYVTQIVRDVARADASAAKLAADADADARIATAAEGLSVRPDAAQGGA
jgi:hypothetical protein